MNTHQSLIKWLICKAYICSLEIWQPLEFICNLIHNLLPKTITIATIVTCQWNFHCYIADKNGKSLIQLIALALLIKGVLGTPFWVVVLSVKAKFPGGAKDTLLG